MSESEGALRMMATGRWAIYRPGRLPVEITSGGLFRVESRPLTGAVFFFVARLTSADMVSPARAGRR